MSDTESSYRICPECGLYLIFVYHHKFAMGMLWECHRDAITDLYSLRGHYKSDMASPWHHHGVYITSPNYANKQKLSSAKFVIFKAGMLSDFLLLSLSALFVCECWGGYW